MVRALGELGGGRSGSGRRAVWLAWALAGLSLVLFLASLWLYALLLSVPIPGEWNLDLSVSGQVYGALYLVFPLVGALISARHPRNAVGWLLLANGLLWMLAPILEYYSAYGMARPGSLPFPVAVAAINEWLWVPSVGLFGTFLLLLFPDGRLPSPRWRPLAWLSGAVILAISAGVGLSPGPMEAAVYQVQNPFGYLPSWIAPFAWALLPLLPLCMLASAASLVQRYRRAGGEQRQQIKWIAFAAAVVVVWYLLAMLASLVYPSETWFEPGSPLWIDVLQYGALLSFNAIPIAVGFAVLKHHLYDIDVVINRTLVYGSLTLTLVATYFGGIVVLQRVFVALTGERSTLAVVASTLLIAALFDPLRRRIQSLIDRRFYRRRYDARKTLELFSSRLRDETDLDVLCEHLTEVAGETVQPAFVALWLRSEAGPERPRAS